jgi:hypothetical protein
MDVIFPVDQDERHLYPGRSVDFCGTRKQSPEVRVSQAKGAPLQAANARRSRATIWPSGAAPRGSLTGRFRARSLALPGERARADVLGRVPAESVAGFALLLSARIAPAVEFRRPCSFR